MEKNLVSDLSLLGIVVDNVQIERMQNLGMTELLQSASKVVRLSSKEEMIMEHTEVDENCSKFQHNSDDYRRNIGKRTVTDNNVYDMSTIAKVKEYFSNASFATTPFAFFDDLDSVESVLGVMDRISIKKIIKTLSLRYYRSPRKFIAKYLNPVPRQSNTVTIFHTNAIENFNIILESRSYYC